MKKAIYTLFLIAASINITSCSSTYNQQPTNNNNKILDQSLTCPYAVDHDTAINAQTISGEVEKCSLVLNTVQTGIQNILDKLNRMNELATQGAESPREEQEYIEFNAEFIDNVSQIQELIANTVYEESTLFTGEQVSYSYTVLESSVACFNTADFNLDDVGNALIGLSVIDQSSSETSKVALRTLLIRLQTVMSESSIISDRVNADIESTSILSSIIAFGKTPKICDFSQIIAANGLKHVERIINNTRQSLANPSIMNSDLSLPTNQAIAQRIIKEMQTGINYALSLSADDGESLLSGTNSLTATCFKNEVYDFRLSTLDLEAIPVSSQDEVISAIKKLDSKVKTIELAKIRMGFSNAAPNLTEMTATLEALTRYKQENPSNTCNDYRIGITTLSLMYGIILTPDLSLSTSNTIFDPIYNSVTVTGQEYCITVISIMESSIATNRDLLLRMRELAQHVIEWPSDGPSIQTEISLRIEEFSQQKNVAVYNDMHLLEGGDVVLKYFFNTKEETCAELSVFNINPLIDAISNIDVSTLEGAESASTVIYSAILDIDNLMATTGSQITKLEKEKSFVTDLASSLTTGIGEGKNYFCQANVDIAKAGLSSMLSIVEKLTELATESADPSYTKDRALLGIFVTKLLSLADDVILFTEVNDHKLINGEDPVCCNNISIDVRPGTLGIAEIDLSTQIKSEEAVTLLGNAAINIQTKIDLLN